MANDNNSWNCGVEGPTDDGYVRALRLRQIKNATKRSTDVKVTHNFKPGQLVRVTSGIMRGIEGYVKREGANMALCLNVEILGSAVEVTISPSDVEKVE